MNAGPRDRRGFMGFIGTAAAVASCCCAGVGKAFAREDAASSPVPGGAKSAKAKALAAGADLLQRHAPVNAMNMYLNGFHFYADDMGRQVEAHHYCHHLNEDFFQCVIYDGNSSNARLIGIEYIVSEKIFKTLPDDEKRLWHSHRHETTSGELVMPGIPAPVEHEAIASLVSTYGKTWHTWQIDRQSTLPLGIPALMMGFTKDGQLDREHVRRRDRALNIRTADEHANREDLAKTAGPVEPGADSWQSGKSLQLVLSEVSLRNIKR
ncbi:OBAP family protein [Caballeronia sp. LP003]|uniref:OBAP family protein n=1 Tax=Caballeronia sp. LP003 TaxID=3038551 RepID=UPI002864358F|nr:OBAP family protein [Caballeronia sp. LP003]MDR5785010.1 OBAP family protein [Caballeronia sp. LP003]